MAEFSFLERPRLNVGYNRSLNWITVHQLVMRNFEIIHKYVGRQLSAALSMHPHHLPFIRVGNQTRHLTLKAEQTIEFSFMLK